MFVVRLLKRLNKLIYT